MTTRKAISQLGLVIAAAATLALTGCSAILGGLGAAVDASKPDQITLPGWEVDTIKPGQAINVILKDGTRLSGKYSGLDRIPAEQYAANYSRAREQKPEGILLPALGDSIDIRLFLGKKLEGPFEGFEHDCILTKLKGGTGLFDVPLSKVTGIASGRGNAISGKTLKRLILEGKIPVSSAIVVEGEAGKTLVAMDNVSQMEVSVKKQHEGAVIGFLIGATVDVVVVVVVVHALRNLDWGWWAE